MIGVNLKGVWLCMKHELPQMIAQPARTYWRSRLVPWAGRVILAAAQVGLPLLRDIDNSVSNISY